MGSVVKDLGSGFQGVQEENQLRVKPALIPHNVLIKWLQKAHPHTKSSAHR